MPASVLFPNVASVADRQPKTDRLVLGRYLEEEATKKVYDAAAIAAAQAILVKWSDLETSGRLAKLNETQMQGDFLAEVFGGALGYVRAVENVPVHHARQHEHIAGDGCGRVVRLG